MTFKDLKLLRFNNFFTTSKGLPILLPFLGYIFFGIGNMFFLSKAFKFLPTPIVFAVWTAVTLVILKLIDVFYLHKKTNFIEAIFLLMIVVGIVGLRFYEKDVK